MSSVERVYAVENAMANGLLTSLKWDQSVTYSVSDTSGDYPSGYILSSLDGIRPMTSAQRETIYNALDTDQVAGLREAFTVEGFTNLDINLVTDGAIKIGSSSNVSGAYAYFPSYSVYGGDVWLGSAGDNPVAGNFDYFAILHELGHALGLKHGHEGTAYDAGQAPKLNTALPAEYNSIEYSIMTYRTYVGQTSGGYKAEGWGYAQTYMMADIAALQELYGADYTANSGDTVYEWTPTDGTTYINGEAAITPGANRIFLTIWDGGGNDTYDLSAYSSDLEINLNPGENSEFSTLQLADLRGGTDDNGTLAGGNVYNALMHQGDKRSLIENAIGGSGDDLIIGNQAANNLAGGSGDDTFEGGAGNDTIDGGAGIDTAIYSGNRADFQATLQADGTVTLADLRPNGAMGQDELRDIEFVEFDDGAVAIEDLFPVPEAPENVVTFSNEDDISGIRFAGDKGSYTVSQDTRAITLTDNAWKQAANDVTVSEDTVLRFEFEADVEGEIHAIGFRTDTTFSSRHVFQLHGGQKWGQQTYNNLYETGTGAQVYEIEVGRHFTGDFDNIVFVMDDDAGLGGNSTFQNIQLLDL